MIKDLKKMAAGTEIRGFPLFIRTARGTFRDADGVLFQEVRFLDKSGEITGHILQDEPGVSEYQSHKTTGLPPGIWRSKQTICIMNGVLQDTDERKKEGVKIVISECFSTAVSLSYEQGQEVEAEDWKQLRQDEIKGKIRHGICCSLIQRVSSQGKINIVPNKEMKSEINELVDFVIKGE